MLHFLNKILQTEIFENQGNYNNMDFFLIINDMDLFMIINDMDLFTAITHFVVQQCILSYLI